MKLTKFEELLAEDLGWRSKEVSTLILLADTNKENVILKSVILVLYAHWEGFVKSSCKYYLIYVNGRGHKINELTHNFQAISLKGLINRCFDSKNTLTLANEIKFMHKYNEENPKYNGIVDIRNEHEKTIIDTRDNLNPNVLKNILTVVGLHYNSQYEAKGQYINSFLVGKRNKIGHGSKHDEDQEFKLEISAVKKLRDDIFAIMENIKDELITHATSEFYLIKNIDSFNIFVEKQEQQMQEIFNNIAKKYD